jgi:hypothetical protein
MVARFSLTPGVDWAAPDCYVMGAHPKERFMRPISGFIVAALAVLALAGCGTSAANNTTYARPAVTGGGVQVPLN